MTTTNRIHTTKKKLLLWSICGLLIIVLLAAVMTFIRPLLFPQWATMPFVKINDTHFIYDGNTPALDTLSDDYIVIGEITSTYNGKPKNGMSSGGQIGEKIYQSPDAPNEVYLYTTMFSGDGTYRYIRFCIE